MAAGDITWFDQALVDTWKKLHDLDTDDIKLGLITNAVAPAATTADPRWGPGGTTNFSTNQATVGGNYASGGPSLANAAVTLDSGAAKFDADDVTIAQHASNPQNARWAIGYNNTDAGKRALFFLDLGGVWDGAAGPLQINWGATGIARKDQ
jgi:hypothetical protein